MTLAVLYIHGGDVSAIVYVRIKGFVEFMLIVGLDSTSYVFFIDAVLWLYCRAISCLVMMCYTVIGERLHCVKLSGMRHSLCNLKMMKLMLMQHIHILQRVEATEAWKLCVF